MARTRARRHPFSGCKQLAVGRTPWATIRLYSTPGNEDARRLIFFISAKVGTSPERNTLKRRTRVAWKALTTPTNSYPLSALLIFHVYRPLATYANISTALDHAVKQALDRLPGR